MATPTEIVTAIDDFIKGNLEAGGVRDYEVAGMHISRHSLTDLVDIRKYFHGEATAAARPGNGVTYAQFNRPK